MTCGVVRMAVVLAVLAACDGGAREEARNQVAAITRGDARRGHEAIERYGCGACHTIPGVRLGRGLVGPPLTEFASRAYVAGQVPNTPQNLVRWIQHPDSIEPGTAMPTLGVSEQEARDIAAYLYAETATDGLGPAHLLPTSLLGGE